MQSPRSPYDVHARPNIQVIGVTENDWCPHFAQLARINRFNTPLRSHRHEHRGVHNAMRGGEPPDPGLGGKVGLQEVEHELGIPNCLRIACFNR